MNPNCPTVLASSLPHLGVIVRIKSHNARERAGKLVALKALLSIKRALYCPHSAADGLYSITPDEVVKLKAATGRWTASIRFPKRVPADLDFNHGGIFG